MANTKENRIQKWQEKNNFVKDIKICQFCGHRTFKDGRMWCLTLAKEAKVKIDDAEVDRNDSCCRWIEWIPFSVPKP